MGSEGVSLSGISLAGSTAFQKVGTSEYGDKNDSAAGLYVTYRKKMVGWIPDQRKVRLEQYSPGGLQPPGEVV